MSSACRREQKKRPSKGPGNPGFSKTWVLWTSLGQRELSSLMECEHCFSVVANGQALRSHCYRSHRTARRSPAPLLPPVPVPPAGAAPEKHLEVGSHFMSPLPVGRDWSLQRRSIGSRSTNEKNFHKFELAALEEQDGSTGYDRTAVLFHHTDCGCGIFCYSPYDEARAARSVTGARDLEPNGYG